MPHADGQEQRRLSELKVARYFKAVMGAVAIVLLAVSIPLGWTVYWSWRLLVAVDTRFSTYDMVEANRCKDEVQRFGSMSLVIPHLIQRCRASQSHVRNQALLMLMYETEHQQEIVNALKEISLDSTAPQYVREDASSVAAFIESNWPESFGTSQIDKSSE